MAELTWPEAIIQVLTQQGQAMHYTEIADAIVSQGLRTNVGATPANSVGSILSVSVNNDSSSPFERVSRGIYALRSSGSAPTTPVVESQSLEASAETGLINAFGMYWRRDRVVWKSNPRILGAQAGGTPVDFGAQLGVYLLHDGARTIYVGRSSARPLGIRLREHNADRLEGRWDRFSWFGVRPVSENAELGAPPASEFSLEALIATMEALLIEGLEPPQNRKGGDDFRAVEFQQVEDPELQEATVLQMLKERLRL